MAQSDLTKLLDARKSQASDERIFSMLLWCVSVHSCQIRPCEGSNSDLRNAISPAVHLSQQLPGVCKATRSIYNLFWRLRPSLATVPTRGLNAPGDDRPIATNSCKRLSQLPDASHILDLAYLALQPTI